MDKKSFTQLYFTDLADGQSDLLVALLSDIGYDGFEEDTSTLQAFIPTENFDRDKLDETIKIIPVNYSLSEIEEENWNAQWESSFQPIVVNGQVAVRAGFHPPFPNLRYDIVITPKMSFGTGHHATTHLMIEKMLGIDLFGKSVLDFGTGTGILAILAEKMGASSITAIDNDDWSIENAKENIAANHCNRILIQKAETIPAEKKYDIILANINLNVILANLPAIAAAARSGAALLFSGFLQGDQSAILSALAQNRLMQLAVAQKGEWICLHAIK